MKNIILAIAIAAISFTSCDSTNKSSESNYTTSSEQIVMDTSNAGSTSSAQALVIKATFSNVSAYVSAHLSEVLNHYFHIRRALTNDDAAEAKNGTMMLLYVISQFDHASLPGVQKVAYNEHITEIKEHANAIIKSANVEVQRTHFAELSVHTYKLVKAFGTRKKIYYNYCPKALNNKGANWLSQRLEIQNPYFKGTEMNGCAKVEQVIERH